MTTPLEDIDYEIYENNKPVIYYDNDNGIIASIYRPNAFSKTFVITFKDGYEIESDDVLDINDMLIYLRGAFELYLKDMNALEEIEQLKG